MIKPIPTNKSHIINREEIILKSDNEAVTDSSVLAEMLDSHYINIIEKNHFARGNNVSDTTQAIDLIVQSYLGHSSIHRIKTTFKNQILSIKSSKNVCGTNPEEIFKLLSVLDTKNAVGIDMIPPKL